LTTSALRASADDAPSAADIELIEAEAWSELQSSLPRVLQVRFGIRVARIGGGVALLASGSDTLAINRTIGMGLRGGCCDADLHAVTAEYAAAGIERFVIQWSPAASARYTAEWFAARGFTVLSRMAKVWRRTSAAIGESSSAFSYDRGLVVSEIGPREADVFERLVARPLGVPDGLEAGVRSTIGQPGWRFYLVRDGERPIAGAALYARGHHAWLGLCATLESDRGRGAQMALLQRRLRDAAADGCTWVSADTVAETSDRPNRSYRNMRRAGFSLLYERPNYLMDRRDPVAET
jgi:hypothetical protein